ncbi:MAG: helix-turn-helix domain-containing protein [Lachnospiraceae bacterium]|nr:helix-turn-helix domain-containing protein [Lachnospiraceae bacterium]
MKKAYSDLDIHFSMDGISIHALNIIYEQFDRTIPLHSHGNSCYEIHYISAGFGTLTANDIAYPIKPNTLFVTGPHIEHAQTPDREEPMQEYCVYLKIKRSSLHRHVSPVVDMVTDTPFWFGQDHQGIHSIMKQLFLELEHRYTGYMNQVELLLSQLLICLVRNYEQAQNSSYHFAPHNLTDSNSIIIEESFLYEYQSLTLETLADRLKISPRQTQRLLQKYYGKTFQQKRTEARMSAASILLQDRQKSISSIADALGYSSAEHFSSAFRNYYQLSPREFRKKQSGF